ncbi:SDR family oxidoreductase [Mangrovimicrobium sediminis]|uniref:SDR family oxidoreductase n=1 Tax=Mangrovimicrobium sediminis TaxID=2562682 RepID=A0A4Z0LYY3_9GAMM|nr:SDR family oxidoreductase [Haliea sp. SAOS-164]TGD72305.1 SDR family oxidoreductase [Haliea sp. SAOS-164]
MLQDSLRLDGRVVLVAGAGGGGLGTTVCRMAAEQGATVVAADRTQAKLDQDIAPLIAEGLSIVTVVADLQTEEGIAAAMDAARAAPGTLFGLVTMVGGGPAHTWAPATKMSRESWHEMFSKNLESMFFMAQAFAAELQAQSLRGAIVAVSSISGLGAGPYHIAYATAKAAIPPVVRTMALELAKSDIRVNAVAPAAMIGPKSLLPPNPELEGRAIPMARQGQHAEVAASIMFLLTDMGSYVTGQCLTVDGGITLKHAHIDEDNTPVMITNEAFLKAMKGEA